MTHDELLAKLNSYQCGSAFAEMFKNAVRAVVELHKPVTDRLPFCSECVTIHQGETDVVNYPCLTIQKIMDELK